MFDSYKASGTRSRCDSETLPAPPPPPPPPPPPAPPLPDPAAPRRATLRLVSI